MRCLKLLAVLPLVACLGACADSAFKGAGENCTNGVDDDSDGLVDCADPQCGQHSACQSALDGGTDKTPPPDVLPPPPTSPRQLAVVVNKIILPKSPNDFAIDLDNNGSKDNKLGAIIALIAGAAQGVDLQAETDAAISGGTVLILAELHANSLQTDPDATLVVHRGRDLDGVAANNFSGSERLGLHADSPKDIRLAGSLNAGNLDSGPGILAVPLPLVPNQPPVTLTLKRARVRGAVSGAGIQSGLLSGAIPMTEVNDILIPALAQLVTGFLNDPSSSQQLLDVLRIFDANKDNVVTADEIKNSIVAQALRPDVVLSGDPDRVPDSLSLGVGFSAVPCQIVK